MKMNYAIIMGIMVLFSSCVQKEVGDSANIFGTLPSLKNGKMQQISSYDRNGGNNDRINIPAGETAEIANIEGPGVISRIWMTIDSRDPHFLRRILLRIYWDDETTPSVEVPIGDFFGSAFQYKHHTPMFIGMSSGGYYSYFPMPFQKRARIEVVNQTGSEVFAFYYQINYQSTKDIPENMAYFHAQWNRDIRTDYKANYTVLEAQGEGHFVGLNFHGQPYNKSLFYLEGDEIIYVDGEEFPSTHGTGLEDYFTSGWYFKNGEFDAAFHGLVHMDSLGRVSAYRHHIMDPIPFKESIKVTLEHGHGNEETVDFSTTAYWYQKEPHTEYGDIDKAGLRIPLQRPVPNGAIEAEDLEVIGATKQIEDMSDYGSDWSSGQQLSLYPKEGENTRLIIPNALEQEYNLQLYFTDGPDYGIVSVSYMGNENQNINGFAPSIIPGKVAELKGVKPIDRNIVLDIKRMGKSSESSGYKIGLDAIVMIPKRNYIPEWYIIGPFPNPRESDDLRYGLDKVYPPEKELDLNAEYQGTEGQTVSWKRLNGKPGGYGMALWEHFDPSEFIISYAVTHVYSPIEQTVPLLIGSDDGAKVFLNDKEIYRFLDVRIAAPDQDRLDISLRKGWNKLMIKAENNFGGYAFYARIIDINNNLKYSIDGK